MKILVLVAVFAMTSAFKYTTEWEMWKREYGKSYSDDDEEIGRQTIFESNKDYVDNHNANSKRWGYTLKLNEFADLDSAEFSKMYNSYVDMRPAGTPRSLFNASEFTACSSDSFDWRTKNVVTGVKNQGQCGSCWAFSTTGSLEGQHALKTGKLVSLSEQNLVDCCVQEGNHGCQGGLMDLAFKCIERMGGIDTESSYPYKGENGKCQFSSSNVGATLTSYKDIPKDDCDSLKQAACTVGPISVAMDASHMSFQLYHSGVYDPFFCSSTKLDHGVLVVGYGNEDGKNYWLIKNSWGTSWGIEGYFKMEDKHDKCGICTSASYPIV